MCRQTERASSVARQIRALTNLAGCRAPPKTFTATPLAQPAPEHPPHTHPTLPAGHLGVRRALGRVPWGGSGSVPAVVTCPAQSEAFGLRCWVTGQKQPLEGPWLFIQISCHPPSGPSGPTGGSLSPAGGSLPLRGGLKGTVVRAVGK